MNASILFSYFEDNWFIVDILSKVSIDIVKILIYTIDSRIKCIKENTSTDDSLNILYDLGGLYLCQLT